MFPRRRLPQPHPCTKFAVLPRDLKKLPPSERAKSQAKSIGDNRCRPGLNDSELDFPSNRGHLSFNDGKRTSCPEIEQNFGAKYGVHSLYTNKETRREGRVSSAVRLLLD